MENEAIVDRLKQYEKVVPTNPRPQLANLPTLRAPPPPPPPSTHPPRPPPAAHDAHHTPTTHGTTHHSTRKEFTFNPRSAGSVDRGSGKRSI